MRLKPAMRFSWRKIGKTRAVSGAGSGHEYPGHHQISVLADDSEAGPRVLYLREPRAGLGA